MEVMKIITISMLSIASLALIFLVNGSAISSASGNSTTNAVSAASSSKTKCDITAFVNNKSNGLNVLDSTGKNAKIMGTIPFNKEGTLVHIIADSSDGSGWLQIDNAGTVRTENIFVSKGWVSPNCWRLLSSAILEG